MTAAIQPARCACNAAPELLRALELAQAVHPAPVLLPNIRVAVALLNSGWIEKHTAGQPLYSGSLYHLTIAGAVALRNARQQQPQEGQ